MLARMVTFRAELKSNISDFLADSDMTCSQTEESVVALAVALADHREEGTPLFPRVLICDDREEVLRVIQGSAPIQIGSGDRNPDTVLRALKKCAPLAVRGWAIWVSRSEQRFDYGVFREPPDPTAIDIRSTLEDLEKGSLHAVLAAQVAPGTVELRSPGTAGLEIHLSGVRQDQAHTIDDQRRLSSWVVEQVPNGHLHDACMSFTTNVFRDLLRQGHGALIAVIEDGSDIPAALLIDAVVLDAPADFLELITRHSEARTSESLSELLAYINLLSGMMQSDGITMFDTAGRVLAFNCFIKTDTGELSPRDLMGGARHRAYVVLCQLVDQNLIRGAFMRSSNGENRSYGKEPSVEQ